MNGALLTITSLSLVVSVVSLAIMAKTAHELKAAKTEVDTTVAEVKAKVEHNTKVVKAAIAGLEF